SEKASSASVRGEMVFPPAEPLPWSAYAVAASARNSTRTSWGLNMDPRNQQGSIEPNGRRYARAIGTLSMEVNVRIGTGENSGIETTEVSRAGEPIVANPETTGWVNAWVMASWMPLQRAASRALTG